MSSARKRKSTDKASEVADDPTPKRTKGCDRRGCQTVFTQPLFCFVRATDKCAKNGHTARWYHVSAGQHYCNECFEYFYRSHKPGHRLYKQWSTIWEREAGNKIPARASSFLADMWLPMWVQCTADGCQKWRKLPPHLELHHVRLEAVRCSNCQLPEDNVVEMAKDPLWVHTLNYTPLLRYADNISSLLTEYFPDGVGISPTTCSIHHKSQATPIDPMLGKVDSGDDGLASVSGAKTSATNGQPMPLDVLHPFNHPKEGPRARAFTPDVMEQEEVETFPEWSKSPAVEVYLTLRNIIVSLWYHNCKEFLVPQRCMQSLSLRGLVRVWCADQLPKVLFFLSRRGYVNSGLLANPPRPFPFPLPKKSSVIVIGAGASGLAAARHLYNFGYEVTVLEASDRIGGRIHDENVKGTCVSRGAMFITGICNNPITVLAHQLGVALHVVNEDKCELMLERGVVVDPPTDVRVEQHFNAALDKLAVWRAHSAGDRSLANKLEEFHQLILKEERVFYTEEERNILGFHYSNLEFACGAPLTDISALHWDHNDAYPQFSGAHALISTGYAFIFSKLCVPGVRLCNRVVAVKREKEGTVLVQCAGGVELRADRVIISVPLTLLKNGSITFTPSLAPRKQLAIRRLGAGLVEKVALKFPFPFWREKTGNADFFGHIANQAQDRGLFGVFYDMSSKSSKTEATPTEPAHGGYFLVTTISGVAVEKYFSMEETEVVECCLKALRAMFPGVTVPEPDSYILTHWGRDRNALMSYSYVATGSSGEDYEALSRDEDGRLFFSGEATNRQIPQSVTGAYLSGVREACKIIERDMMWHV